LHITSTLMTGIITRFALTAALALPFSHQLIAQDAFTSFAGSYQGLLIEQSGGVLAGKIDFATTARGVVSGVLQLKNRKTYRFKGSLTSTGDSATLSNLDVIKPTESLSLKLTLILNANGSFNVIGSASLPDFSGGFIGREGTCSRLSTYTSKSNECPWAGQFTMAFHTPRNEGSASPPGGASVASASVKPNGAMAVKGILADGTKFTASGRPSEDQSYHFFFNVHKTAGSYFTTSFRLSARDDGWYQAEGAQASARWAKSPRSEDKSFPSGFDVRLKTDIVEWKKPSQGQQLRDLLGFGAVNALSTSFSGAVSAADYANFLPTSLGLSEKNAFRVASAQGGPGLPDETAWSKIFAGRIDANTGLISAVLNVENNISGQKVKRKIIINGVSMQLESDDLSEPFAFGHLLIPPLASTTDTLSSGNFQLVGPMTENPLFVSASNTAGDYSAVLTMVAAATPAPSGAPANGSTARFAVASNLRVLTFNGRKISLQGDSRPVSLVYSDAAKSPMNNLTVTLFLHPNGAVRDIAVQYVQVAGFVPKIRNYTSNAVTKK